MEYIAYTNYRGINAAIKAVSALELVIERRNLDLDLPLDETYETLREPFQHDHLYYRDFHLILTESELTVVGYGASVLLKHGVKSARLREHLQCWFELSEPVRRARRSRG